MRKGICVNCGKPVAEHESPTYPGKIRLGHLRRSGTYYYFCYNKGPERAALPTLKEDDMTPEELLHEIFAAPTTRTFRWTVTGTEQASRPGALERGFQDSDTLDVEHAGEVVEWLAAHGPFWDTLDADAPFTIRVEPCDEPDADVGAQSHSLDK